MSTRPDNRLDSPADEESDTNPNLSLHAALAPTGEPGPRRRGRPISFAVLAVLATIALLHFAAAVFIPLVVSVLLSYALSPPVDWLSRRGVPRALSAAVIVVGIVVGLGALVYSLHDDAVAWLDGLPAAAQKFQKSLRNNGNAGAFDKMKQAADQIERAAAEATGAPPAKNVPRVQVVERQFKLTDYLWAGSVSVAAAVGQLTAVLFLVFFLLASGDLYKRKLVKIAGPTFAEKRITVEILDDINRQIARFLFITVVSGALVALATWLALRLLGLENPGVWGVVAGVMNSLPYIGPIVVAGGTGMVAFMQFDTLSMAMLVGGVTAVITSVEGLLLLPWLTSRAARMNAVAVFVSLLFWGWLWGGWGLLLAVPIMMVIKAVCDHVERFKPIGELLGT